MTLGRNVVRVGFYVVWLVDGAIMGWTLHDLHARPVTYFLIASMVFLGLVLSWCWMRTE